MYRTFVIIRYTFLEAILQPIFALVLILGAAILVLFGVLPFFTLGEDTQMAKSVSVDIILLLVLVSTLFTTSKSIYDEIEDRTMLTLMSKPVARWEVIVGKYLGIIFSSGFAVAILGGILCLTIWMRVPGDYYLDTYSLDDLVRKQILDTRSMHIYGMMPQLVLTWLQISVLAAVGIALSTRFSLVVNLPAVIMVYVAGNMTRFLSDVVAGRSVVVKGFAWFIGLLFPYLESFDLKDLTLMTATRLQNTSFAADTHAVNLSTLWAYVGFATIYAAAYVFFALSAGLWSFQTRELGGGEG